MVKFIGALCIVFLLLGSCKSKQEKTNPVEENITESVYASGIVKSRNQYQVYSSVNGIIADLLVKEGDEVKKGDRIIRLSNTTAQLNTENAEIAAAYSSVPANTEKINELKISVDLAKAKMDNEALMLGRQQNLWKEQIGSRNEVDQRELAFKNASIAFETARLRLTEMQKQINFQSRQSQKNVEISKTVSGDYTIKSETDGKVYNILKEKGEMVNTQTPVALIGDARIFILELQVDEYDIARIRTGQLIVLSMDSYKGQVYEAVVERINPIMNERSKSFTVEASFVKQPPALYPNLTCEANIVIQKKEKVLTVPRSYLLEGDYVLLENKEQKKVTTGLKDYQKVEILTGLTVHDIILKPVQ